MDSFKRLRLTGVVASAFFFSFFALNDFFSVVKAGCCGFVSSCSPPSLEVLAASFNVTTLRVNDGDDPSLAICSAATAGSCCCCIRANEDEPTAAAAAAAVVRSRLSPPQSRSCATNTIKNPATTSRTPSRAGWAHTVDVHANGLVLIL